MMRHEQADTPVQTPNVDPSAPTSPVGPGPAAPPGKSRLGSALVASTVGMLLALAMVVFVLQNDTRQAYEFLWFDFTLPDGIAMLLSAICGGLIVALIGLGRVLQLRLAARRIRRSDHPAV